MFIRQPTSVFDPAKPDTRFSKKGLACLALIYIIWGSTYLAIRISVREGSGFEPFYLGASRTLASAILLLAWAALRKERLIPDREEVGVLFVSGLFLWIGGNALVMLAVRTADSGLAALLVGSMPIWTAIVTSVWDRKPPAPKLFGAILLGFIGLSVLSWPVLRAGIHAELWSLLALIVAPLLWGFGSVLITRRPTRLMPASLAAYQQLFGAVGFLALAILLEEPWPNPIAEAWAAWAYLMFFGGVVAFTSFLVALKELPTDITMTYAYANPVIAVFLGWAVLDESVTGWTLSGAALILLSIAGVFRQKRSR